MQKFSNISLIAFVVILLCAGCSRRQPQYRIGVSQCLDDAWRQKMNEEMERELLLHPDMSITRKRIANGNSRLQCAQIDSFIAERVDLLIVSPNVAEEVKPAVTRAFFRGIPVIVADRRVSGGEWNAFIGGDNYKVGMLMADWIRQVQSQTAHPLHVLEVCGLPGSTPATMRHNGLMEILAASGKPIPEIVSLQGQWMKEDAYEAVSAYLHDHKNIDAIVAQNDLMAIGSAEAVRDSKDYGTGTVRIMGVDGISVGLQAVADGVIECTATYASRGDMIIETASAILHHQPFVRDTVLETTMIESATARAMLMQYRERMHDIETFRIVQVNSDTRWHQMMADRRLLIAGVIVAGVLFFLALGALLWMQTRIQKEIKRDILPQLVDVQEAIQLSKRDEAFAERMRLIVDDHLTNPDLNVEFLAGKLQLSRTQFFRRVKTITGKGPLDFIRERRLIRAHHLLQTTDMTIQQVAYELCFSSPGYFSKCYKAYFGHLPSKQ